MRTFGMLVLIGVLGLPLVATAEESVQQPSQERTRSMGRTWGGVALIAGGLFVPVQTEVCLFSACIKEAYTPGIAIASGMIVSGLLLATVWSDVPVVRNMTVAPTRGGVQVGASFGF